MLNKTDKKAGMVRVYEYVSGDGTTYWSFTKHQQTVSPPTRLVLQDRLGLPLLRFVTLMRQRGSGVATGDEDGV